MSITKNINLQFSCPKGLSPTTKGATDYCSHCNRELTDFTNSTPESLREAIKNSSNTSCGKFKRSQLSDRFLKYAAATFIASGTIASNISAQDIKLDSIQSFEEIEDSKIFFGSIIEIQAVPEIGYEKFFQGIYNEIQIPETLKTSGKVFIQFEIDTLGFMQEIQSVKSYQISATKEVIRALKKLNFRFKPAEQRGIKVKTRMIIPIVFKLDK